MSSNSKEEDSSKINSDLKTQLVHILEQVDLSIATHYTQKSSYSNNTPSANKATRTPNNSFHSELYHYQSQMKELNGKIARSLCVSKLNEKEADLKNNQAILTYLTKENQMLFRLNSLQKKDIEEISSSEADQSHKASLIYKNKNLKDEIRIMRDHHKGSLNKIKEQDNEIENMNNLIQLIKKNIEWIKEQNEDGNTVNNSKNQSEIIHDLTSNAQEKQKRINEDMNHYITTSNEYDKSIMRLDQEISLIEVELKHKEEMLRINDLKVKELKRIEISHMKHIKKSERPTKSQEKEAKKKPHVINIMKNYSLEHQLKKFQQPMKTNSVVLNQIEGLRKDIEDVLNADIEYRYNELNPEDKEDFNEDMKNIQVIETEDQYIDSNEGGKRAEEKENKLNAMIIMRNNPEVDNVSDSINESIKENQGNELFIKEEKDMVENEYSKIETKDKRKPFGAFEFPK